KKIIQVDQAMFETELDRMVSRKVEEILDAMLDTDAERVAGAGRYERSDGRKAYLAGHYERRLTVKAGGMTVRVPRLKGALFESAVIQRHRTRESSVEEALMEMYFSGVSTRQVDAVGERLWG
ncbi:IS256 family transposase, partial [Bacillus subtilis]|nr:IS256 family transposase [Bacillus subtilis]